MDRGVGDLVLAFFSERVTGLKSGRFRTTRYKVQLKYNHVQIYV